MSPKTSRSQTSRLSTATPPSSKANFLANDASAYTPLTPDSESDKERQLSGAGDDFIFPEFRETLASYRASLPVTQARLPNPYSDSDGSEDITSDRGSPADHLLGSPPWDHLVHDTEEDEDEDIVFTDIYELDEGDLSDSDISTHKAMQYESRCLSELAPHFFVAFEESEFLAATCGGQGSEPLKTLEEGLPFTHILKIERSHCLVLPDKDSVLYVCDLEKRVSTLILLIPFSDPDEDVLPPCLYNPTFSPGPSHKLKDISIMGPRDVLLTPYQLLALRDFISASTYSPRTTPPFSPSPSSQDSKDSGLAAVANATLNPSDPQLSDGPHHPLTESEIPPHTASPGEDIRILITCPRDRRADVIAAAAFYLSWELNFFVEDVVGAFSDNEEACAVWRSTDLGGTGYEDDNDDCCSSPFLEIGDEEEDASSEKTMVGWAEGDPLCKRDVDWLEALLDRIPDED